MNKQNNVYIYIYIDRFIYLVIQIYLYIIIFAYMNVSESGHAEARLLLDQLL